MVDIITCVRNGEKYLNQCIESVLNQTYEDFTYYIVDNASSDNSKKIIEDYQEKDARIIYLYQPIKGLSRSLNLAISASKNEYLCFLDADDLYHPKKINKQI
jgi:teichuronic acid biosynthesis glycosyltransferase TuaG